MFITKGYKNNEYLVFNHPISGKRTKMTLKNLEKVLFDFYTDKPAENIIRLESFKIEVLKYARSNFSKSNAFLYENALNNLIRVFGNLPLNLITAKNFETYKDNRAEAVKLTSVNVEVRTLKAIFNLACKWEYITRNPVKDVKQYTIPQAEPSVFSSADITLLLSLISSEVIRNIVLFASLSGCRLSEILNLQIGDIDLKNLILVIRNKENFKTKSRKIRRIPISEKLAELLRGIIYPKNNVYSLPETYLFNHNGFKFQKDYISRSFKKALRLAGFDERFHFHCIRHSFVTNLIKEGVNINFVKEIAGHSDIKTTMGYCHLVTEDLRNAVNRI